MANENKNRPTHEVFVIRDTNNDQSRWTKIGIGFENRDGSVNMLLDAAPMTPKVHVRRIENVG